MTTAPTYETVRACSAAILSGIVLQAGGVSAGRGTVIDWRTVRSGETLTEGADAFDCAQLFVALVGLEAAGSVVDELELPPPAPAPRVAPEITTWMADANGRRARTFYAPGGFRVTVDGHDDDAAQASFITRLASAADAFGF